MSAVTDGDDRLPSVLVVNYGMGNLRSIVNAFTAIGAAVSVTTDPEELHAAERVVLPGVGAFGDGIESLREGGWVEPLEAAVERGAPVLGVCLGMQLLAETSTEHGMHRGLGWISGPVRRLVSTEPGIRIPHVGWNDVELVAASPLLVGLGPSPSFYFVHSFAMDAAGTAVCAVSVHGAPFAAVVQQDNVFGVQFHPEKSHTTGLQLLRNFLALPRP